MTRSILLVASFALFSNTLCGSILGGNSTSIAFSNPKEAETKASWAEGMKLTSYGLGFDLPTNNDRSGWLRTKPISIGTSWRPARSANLEAVVTIKKNETSVPKSDTALIVTQVYYRYSPDFKNWSTWQVLNQSQKDNEIRFTGFIQVPLQERANYDHLLQSYEKLDVPWKSDENAAVKWIIKNDSHFFEHNLPFVGYIEFLLEANFPSGQYIHSFEASARYGIGGIAAAPKDRTVMQKRWGEWEFKAP